MPTHRSASKWRLVATCSRGLEGVLRDELVALGHPEAEAGRGMVAFRGGFDAVYDANLGLRTAMRVLRELAEGPTGSRDELYRLVAGVPWEDVFPQGGTFAVESAGRGAAFPNRAFASLVVKDAIVDRLRDRWGFRPDVRRGAPDLSVQVHLAGERAGVALDASGEPLSHRGYRPAGGPAPLSEALAAGILLLAGYDGSRPFLDPMAGTGTLAIEAALIATRTAPGIARRFACERWLGHDAARLDAARAHCSSARRRPPAPIVAADVERRAVAAVARNAKAAGVAGDVEAVVRDVRDLAPPGPGTVIVCNPPYGERLGDRAELVALYRAIGDALKRRGAGATAWLLAGNLELAKAIGLRPSRRIVLFNGPIECRLLRFDLYEGGRRVAE